MSNTIRRKSFLRTLLGSFQVLNRHQWQAPWRDRSPL